MSRLSALVQPRNGASGVQEVLSQGAVAKRYRKANLNQGTDEDNDERVDDDDEDKAYEYKGGASDSPVSQVSKLSKMYDHKSLNLLASLPVQYK